ncbi:ROK family protein [Mucilaginibacter pocheonensis]|uniref:Polyphosphate glucokinase n=1 Tax=Mucilaginibacter pocheonensis TaxID=398050 RepID=A0ABU1TAE0_9SPHI|nr:ROK family protein [Mucilaginibacter pocheonensis]MDR6942313.1 polyphosphate glucokinase [Mucilaginibacter pocheonensis]
MKNTPSQLKILSIDIGGSHIKATVLNSKGELKMDYDKIPTPAPSNPENLIKAIKTLVKDFPAYDKISVGFPGYVKNGVIQTAPNLNTKLWAGTDLSKKLAEALGKPTQVVNDADMQGLGVVSGKGLEMVITLGTGFGTALLMDGHLLPHLELAHHPFKDGDTTYDKYIGEKALEKYGKERWNKRIQKVFKVLKTVFNYDTLYIGGGNSDLLTFKLDKNMKIVTNADGIKGGSRLWLSEDESKTKRSLATPAK